MTLRVVAGLVALWPALAFAQRAEEGAERPAPAPEAPSLLAGAVDPDKYVVGPGDKLLIALWGLQEQTRETEVNAEGRLVLPRIGVFPSAGKTLSALREEVVRRLKSAYPRLNASLTLLRPRSFAVFIVGAVARPGSYRATPVTRVSGPVLNVWSISTWALRLPPQVRGTITCVPWPRTLTMEVRPP